MAEQPKRLGPDSSAWWRPRRSATPKLPRSTDVPLDSSSTWPSYNLVPSTQPEQMSVQHNGNSSAGANATGRDAKITERWDDLATSLRTYDESRTKDCNDDIDTLLVFAGLFSAVLTAFNVESYTTLQQDSGDTSVAALLQISRQISSLASGASSTNGSQLAFTIPEFRPPGSAIRINTLWFTSLVLSLVSASLGILVKQWLREYLTGNLASPLEQIRVRHNRYHGGLIRWRVFEIAAIPPLLLQLSLILFFVGLNDFLRQLNAFVGWFVTTLIIIWLLLFAASLFAPLFSFRCPYKLPLFKTISGTARHLVFLFPGLKVQGERIKGDYERYIRRKWQLDIPAIIEADECLSDDHFLLSIIRPCLENRRLEGEMVVLFMKRMLEHRLSHAVSSLHLDISIIAFKQLTTTALTASIHIAIDLLKNTLDRSDLRQGDHGRMPWIREALVYLFAAIHHSYQESRWIGDAMDRGIEVQGILMKTGDPYFIQECLTLMSAYSNVPSHEYQVASADASLIMQNAQSLLDAGVVNPLELCRVIFAIASKQKDLHTMYSGQGYFRRLLSSLTRAIQYRVPFVSSRSDHAAAESCYNLAVVLNAKLAGFVPSDLVHCLAALQASRHGATV